MTRGLVFVLGLEEEPDIHRRQRGMLEAFAPFEIVWTGSPREIVNVFLIEVMGAAAVHPVSDILLDTGGSDDPVARDGEAHVVDTEVGEEFG